MMQEEYIKKYSPSLQMDMELLRIGYAGKPILLFPTSMGRYYQNKDFKLCDAVAPAVDAGKIMLYCVDGLDNWSWYNKQIAAQMWLQHHLQYERYLIHELIPHIMYESQESKIIVAGCSFGGYHAINLAFKYPQLFSHVFSMSGTFDIRSFLDGFYNDETYFNNPIDFIPNNNDTQLYHMKIVLGTTDRDVCRAENENLSHILNLKGINHWLDIRSNADHDWPIWREMFADYVTQL